MDLRYRIRSVRWVPLLFLLFSFFEGGCATEARYGKVVDSWIGKKSSQLFWAWNYPNKQITAPDGNTVYIYHNSRTLDFSQTYSNAPQYYTSYGTYSAGPSYTTTQIQKLTCTTWFEIDKKTSRIKKVFFKGDLCMAGGLGSDDPPPPPTPLNKD